MDLVPLPQLADPDAYEPNTFTFKSRAELEAAGQPTFPALEDWLAIFYGSIEPFARTAAASDPADPPAAAAKAEAFAAAYRAALDAAVASGSEITCIQLCQLREAALRGAGLPDAFLHIKRLENENALKVLPEVLAELDAEADPAARWAMAVRGVCAANIFDLGAAATAEMYHAAGGVAFHDARERLLPRPWAVDDLDALVARLSSGAPYKKALLFVDNSGADVILGMVPLARELLRAGTAVVIAANELPSINDITAAELDAMLPALAAADGALCRGISSAALAVVSSGNGLPVIDLRRVSPEVAAAAGDADIVVIEGMGRSIETNLAAALTCDALKIGMVKHPEVAAALGGRMYDCVVKFDRV